MTHREAAEKEMARKLQAAWRDILSTSEGRMVMHSLMGSCGIFASTFTGDRRGDFLEGRRSVALELQSVYLEQQGAEIYGRMLVEAELRMREIEAAAARDGDQFDG
ncbi:MAG: hypothetical protein ACRC0L_02135 [Angustibacter sp.]